MQDLLSSFRIFIDTGFFSCAFGLIFVHGLLPLFRWVFQIFVSFLQNKHF